MLIFNKKYNSSQRTVIGNGLLNKLINKLPIELHLPGYQYCGPGTKLEERLKRGDPGINPLDAACKLHDIAYEKEKNLKERHIADNQLAQRAWERVKAPDSSLKEKASAWFVTNAMKTKMKFGMGISQSKKKNPKVKKKNLKAKKKTGKGISKSKKKNLKMKKKNPKQNLLSYAINKAKAEVKKRKSKNLNDAINISQNIARQIFNTAKLMPTLPRIIPVPKTGGFLPLAPIIAALGSLGGLSGLIGGVSSIAKTIHTIKNARDQLAEAKRHNKAMETVSVGKGLYLKPYKQGFGLCSRLQAKNY